MTHLPSIHASEVVDAVFSHLLSNPTISTRSTAVQEIVDALDAAGLTFSQYLTELAYYPPLASCSSRWRFSQRERAFQRVHRAINQLCAASSASALQRPH